MIGFAHGLKRPVEPDGNAKTSPTPRRLNDDHLPPPRVSRDFPFEFHERLIISRRANSRRNRTRASVRARRTELGKFVKRDGRGKFLRGTIFSRRALIPNMSQLSLGNANRRKLGSSVNFEHSSAAPASARARATRRFTAVVKFNARALCRSLAHERSHGREMKSCGKRWLVIEFSPGEKVRRELAREFTPLLTRAARSPTRRDDATPADGKRVNILSSR